MQARPLGRPMLLRSVNLNLIPTLRALLQERGVSRAANVLSMSQAAVSESLAQLRVALDDQLLVRVGAQMALTPRAEQLLDTVNRVCDDIEAILAKQAFSPAESDRKFVISTTDHYVYLFGQEIIRRVGAESRKAEVHFVHWTADSADRMASREVDLGIMPRFMIEDFSTAPVKLKTLFQDRIVLVFANSHPLASRQTLTESDLAPYRRILYSMNEVEGKRRRSPEFQQSQIAARVWPLLLGPLLLPGTEHMSMVPLSLAARMQRDLPLQWRDLPLMTTEVNCCIAWSTRMEADPGHHWFRRLVEGVLLQHQAGAQPATGQR